MTSGGVQSPSEIGSFTTYRSHKTDLNSGREAYMKIKDGFIQRTIGDTNIIVPVAEMVIEFKGMITLNNISADIWNFLSVDKSYDEVLEHILSSYDIDRDTAKSDLDRLLNHMESSGVLEI